MSDWGVGNPDFANRVVEPSTAKKQAAWLDDERPPAPIANWLWYIHDQWIKYFESVTDAEGTKYDVIIGSGPAATHGTLQAAVNDGLLGTDLVVRIDDNYTVNTAISLTKARWRIDFRPGVVYSKGAATKCLSLEAEGIVINHGRLTGWTGGGDAAIAQNAAAEYCTVFNTRFGVGTTLEVDQTLVPAGKKGPVTATITEV
jgi:hypothetical protein